MLRRLRAIAEKLKNASKGRLETTDEETESIVCPVRFNSDECCEIMCDVGSLQKHIR
jgi:hypothetical protein